MRYIVSTTDAYVFVDADSVDIAALLGVDKMYPGLESDDTGTITERDDKHLVICRNGVRVIVTVAASEEE